MNAQVLTNGPVMGAKGAGGEEKLPLTEHTMNPHVRAVEYAVRGPIVTRAAELEKELAAVCASLVL